MPSLTVTFVGSGDAFGSGGRLQTCIHVASAVGSFLVDCGTSSLIGMKRLGIDPSSIGLVLLTHLHGDHFGGVPFLVLDGQFTRREAPLVVAGPPGVEARVQQAMEVLFPGSTAVARKFPVTFVEWSAGQSWVGAGVTVTPHPVSHPSGAPPFALRIEAAGRTLAYTGDTEWTDTLVPAAQGADLLIAEALFAEKVVRYHMSLSILRPHLQAIGAKRVVLTHMGPEMLAQADRCGIECATDGHMVRVE
ncbi:MAG TPA: MBL fold metallo-hydrolase [bacterium]